MIECIAKRCEQHNEIALAVRFPFKIQEYLLILFIFSYFQKIVCPRLPTIKYAVGLVMIYNYIACGLKHSQLCVIVSWDAKFQRSEEWLTWPSPKNLEQPFYRILGPKIEYGKLYVAEGNIIRSKVVFSICRLTGYNSFLDCLYCRDFGAPSIRCCHRT